MGNEKKAGKALWAGRALSVLAAFPFLLSSIMKLKGSADVIQGFSHLGWPESSIMTIAILELFCVVLYVIPQSAVFGAILLTGYIGGAIATHLRLGEPTFTQIIIGLLIWGSLYLREPRLRKILPLRSAN